MRRFERYFVVTIAVTMILMANTVNATFNLIPSRKTQSLTVSLNSDLKSQVSQSNNNLFSSSKEEQNGRSESNFLDLWKSGVNTSESDLKRVSDYGDFFSKDNNSMELVIGVNRALPDAYNNIINKVKDEKGEVVNTVSAQGEVLAIVADVPSIVAYSLMKDFATSNLAQYMEPNRKFQAQLVPSDQYWSLQWGPQKIQADLAWNTTTGDSSVLVAVIDTGIDYTHPDLADNYVPLGHNWVSGTDDPLDDNGHGTHCAGIIAAVLNNAIGIAGLAQVRIMAEKGLDAYGSGYEDDLANAIIDAVDKGAQILSNSWGGSTDSILIHEAVEYAYNHSVLIIAAAGNSGNEVKLYPAAYDEVVAVTATDSNDLKASFSSYGDWVEVAAPGVGIYSTLPTYHVTLNDRGYSMNYDYLSGTSMACPHVAGEAALIWSRFPNASRDWVRARLRYTADDLGSPGFDIYYGYGRINAYNATVRALPNHDVLIVNLEKPKYIQPGDIALLNATVLNFGANAENNVTVELLVNGSLTDSKTISYLANLTSAIVSLSWNPLIEGTYNVTLYAVPISGETNIENNLVSEMIPIKDIIGFVLFDQTRCEPIDWYSEWVTNLTDRGYAVDAYSAGFITPDVLAGYDIFVIPAAISDYLTDEISAIQNFVIDGGGLLVIGDYQPTTYTNLTSFAGITWAFYYGWAGTTYNIMPHDVTEDVSEAYFGYPQCELFVSLPAEGVILDGSTDSHVMLAVSEVGAGRAIGISDQETVDNQNIGNADNLRLANNMVDWLLGVKYEHELVVRLDAPSYLVPDESTQLNATVYNRGLHNETNVEFELLIDGIVESNVTIPLLENGTEYSINYAWAPSVTAVYNVTAYATPVPGENITLNNVKTKFVSVHYPLINPEPGQYSNYILNLYYPSGDLMGTGYLNFTYEYYIEPHKIYVTLWEMAPDGSISTGWLIVNTMNRLVEAGVWASLWYPGWIETNIDIGSTINLVYGVATVNGTRTMVIGPRAIDCWEISELMSGIPYTFWYDEASGLWIRMELTIPFYGLEELVLADTNIPIGIQHEHDLGVTIEAPQKLQPSDSSILSATVYNLGLNNESSVAIQILINGTSVASASSLYLANGTWYTLDYNWTTPIAEGIYNVTAYASPVIDENVTINNIASKIVNVRFIKVALISANSELMTIASILDSVGIGYDVYNDNIMYLYTENLSLLLKYKAVIFYNSYRSITLNEYSALESYLSAGGTLLVTGYDCLVSDAFLANIVRSSSTGDDTGQYDLIVVDNTHPIMNGPYGSFPAGYDIYGLYGDCDRVEANTARGAVTVAELADGYDRIIATEGLPGKVVFWNGEGTYDWTFNSDCQIMLKNLMHWFLARYEHELTVHLQTPLFLEPGCSATLNATVTNDGLSDEADVNLQLLINGTLIENVTVPMLLNGSSYTINYLWTPNHTGKYNVTVYAPPVLNETITANNIYSKLVPVQYAPRILAYVEYTDYYQDYRNTLKAINSTFGPNYIMTELYSYAQLGSMLQEKDILLIPDQEYASLNTMEMIGEAWAGTLSEFLEYGGTIILCDGGYGYGVTYGILTGANLMQISGTYYRSSYQLHLVDPSDPLAKGVPTYFNSPYYTVSYETGETNVVVDDGAYPVVIHKKVGQGDIALLGFDFEYSNEDTERILGNAVELGIRITISVDVNSGSPGAEVRVSGIKATPNGTVSIYWDDTLAGNTTASGLGNFVYFLTVPEDASVGVHEIKAVDVTTDRTASMLFKVIQIALNPAKGPVGTKVTVYGSGFMPSIQATVTFNDMLMGYANVDSFGNFTFTLNVPLSAAGVQTIKAFETGGNYAFAMFTVVDVTPLDVTVDVGAIHFVGEVAEFYAQVSLKGIAVNATNINAILYKPDGATESLSPQLIATGLYKIPYTLVGNETGTYTLVVTAGYASDTTESNGTSFKCFLVSPTLALMNNRVIDIKDGLALVQNDLGFVKLNLTAMNVTLQSIFLKVININGTTATIQTMIGVMNGTITGIDNNTATIVTPIGNIEADVSNLIGTQQAWIIPQYAIAIIALIAAVSSTLTLFFIRRRKTVEAK